MVLEKAAGELLGMGPSATHRESVRRTWFGTLLGESVVLLGLLLLYGAATALLLEGLERSADITLDDLIAVGGWRLAAAVFLAVPAFILIFKGGPAAARALRERRLRPLAANPEGTAPGYFRLHPYDAAGAGGYVARTDLRERFIVRMLKDQGSVYYLSGASGVGKSSLVAAEIAPAFEARGWKVLDGRGIGDSYGAVAAAVGRVERLLGLDPGGPVGADALAAAARASVHLRSRVASGLMQERREGEGLLIVVDQFEEFLILEDDARRVEFADLLRRFAEDPVPRVKLLLVFREDYRALLFKQGLPDYVPGQTGFEIAPFTRAEAEMFLRGGPKLMDAAGYDALFRGLDGVEQARGLYRPITLNMVGLVLSRTGAQLTDDPARLVERYLADCLAKGRSRDFAKPVLEAMITTAGTKEPRTVGDIAGLTGLAEWQVRATLVDLQQDGLVRPLARDGLWEVSHDFLARLLSGMIGRLKPPALRRAAPWAIGLAAIGWAGSLALAAPLYLSVQRETTLGDIRGLGFNRMASAGQDYGFDAEPSVGNHELAGLVVLATSRRLAPRLVALDLMRTAVDDLGPLSGLDQLATLDLRYTAVDDLGPLSGLDQLASLDLGSTAVEDLGPLSGLDQLISLDLGGTAVDDLGPLSGLDQLTALDLGSTAVEDLGPLSDLDQLITLDLRYTAVHDLGPLSGLDQLATLDLSSTAVEDISPLSGLDQLATLDLRNTAVDDLGPLTGLDQLTSLDLRLTAVGDLGPVACMPRLFILLDPAQEAALEEARAACP